MTTTRTPTDRWLSSVPALPPLTGATGVGERLLLLAHFGMDWTSWIGGYRTRYWDVLLPDRVVVATFRADTLLGWWSVLVGELPTSPRTAAQRLEVGQLLTDPDPEQVLTALRLHTDALVLRARIVADAVRAQRPTLTGADR